MRSKRKTLNTNEGTDVLRTVFTNWNVIEKYFRMNFHNRLSVKNDLLRLLCKASFEAHFFSNPIYLFSLGRYLKVTMCIKIPNPKQTFLLP